jgi:quinoprotein glucose dehydrogenase
MSVDEARGLLYVPTSTPSGDFWGGRRPGANLFAESLLCLDANTGQRKWHFQAVHHGLWDYDFSSAPTQLTITVDGRRIDAVAESGKTGFTYVFDRVTGQPVWPIVERPVDTTTDVPGEAIYPTQPFPTKPPAFVPQGISLADANDLTPEIHALALEELKQFRLGPLYTPPSLQGTIQRPSSGGGANWGSSGGDPETGMLYLKVSQHVSTNQVCKVDEKYPMRFQGVLTDIEYYTNCPFNTAGTGAYGMPREPRKLGAVPVIKPPYASLVAMDLNKGEIAWRTTLGEGAAAIRRSPLLKGVKIPDRLGTHGNTGGLVITKGGVIFAAMAEPHLYAFDKATGREISRVATPFNVNGAPMTYRSRAGRQFVVVATGGGTESALAAFALPAQ